MAKSTPQRTTSASVVYETRPSNAQLLEPRIEATLGSDGRLAVRLDVNAEHCLCVGADGALCGIFVVTNSTAQIGKPVQLELSWPNAQPLALRGKVAWAVSVPRHSLRQRPGLGIRLELDSARLATLSRLVVLRQPISWPPDAA
ncbi:MAG: hypothetical protein JNG84_14175 [Archangium sp.]|nr:hypothetical protein [Archangium sp.]